MIIEFIHSTAARERVEVKLDGTALISRQVNAP